MRNILTIAGKELRIYFTTPTSYALLGVFASIMAYFFQALIGEFQKTVAQSVQMNAEWVLEQLNLTDFVIFPLIMNIGVIFIFLMPILTMRLIADERRSKTLELLMTTPVRPVEIVLGKYIAALTIMLAMLFVTLLFPAVVALMGVSQDASPIDWRTVASGYLGAALLGAAYTAVGVLTSSLTDNPIIAAIMGFFILLMLYIAGASGAGQEGAIKSVMEYVSLSSHLQSFARGVIRTPAIIYYSSFAGFALFLAYRVVDAERWR